MRLFLLSTFRGYITFATGAEKQSRVLAFKLSPMSQIQTSRGVDVIRGVPGERMDRFDTERDGTHWKVFSAI